MSIVTMQLSCTITAMWHLKDKWGHDLDLLWPRDVIGHKIIWPAMGHFLWVVFVTMHLSCTIRDMASQS